MAAAPPPYSEQGGYQPPSNPNYPAGGYQPYPPANPGYVDPSKGAQPGYPPQQQPHPGYPPQQMQAPPPQQGQQQQTIVVSTGPVVTGNCPVCRVVQFLHKYHQYCRYTEYAACHGRFICGTVHHAVHCRDEKVTTLFNESR